jgi:signal transduction histidine kinase
VTSRLQAHRINMIGIMYDITTRKLHERQKDEFIGIACHELRTPVTSIKAYGQLLQRQLAEHASAHEHEGRPSFEEEARIIERLVYQSDRLSQLVRRLLDTTRIAEHKLELDYGWFDWETLVEHCIDAVRAGDVISSITFENGRVGKVYADQERIQQVCLNLLSNALKFSGPGSPIIVRTWRENGRAGFSVKDYGAGIPESMIETVFEPFVQLKQRTAAGHSGLGLGLYISAGIIHRHGGEIGAQSKPGEGALFYFTIPAIPTGNTDRP